MACFPRRASKAAALREGAVKRYEEGGLCCSFLFEITCHKLSSLRSFFKKKIYAFIFFLGTMEVNFA